MDQVPPLQWACQSVALTLANKAVYSNALFDFPWLCLGIQSLTVVAALSVLSVLRGRRPNVSKVVAAEMLLPALLFLLYQFSYARSLRFISLPAYTVVKSIAPLAVTVVESAVYRDHIPAGVYVAFAVSLVGNILTFDFSTNVAMLKGYAWAVFHVGAHIMFVLSLRACSEEYTATDKAFLTNLISLPFVIPMAVLNVETATFVTQVEILPSYMMLPLAASFGLSAGCAVSVLAAYETASSNALRYLVLLNKIAVVSLGAYFFSSNLSPFGWLGVVLSILSGYIFVFSKTRVSISALPRPIVSSPSLEMLLPSSDDTVDDDAEQTRGAGKGGAGEKVGYEKARASADDRISA